MMLPARTLRFARYFSVTSPVNILIWSCMVVSSTMVAKILSMNLSTKSLLTTPFTASRSASFSTWRMVSRCFFKSSADSRWAYSSDSSSLAVSISAVHCLFMDRKSRSLISPVAASWSSFCFFFSASSMICSCSSICSVIPPLPARLVYSSMYRSI